MFFKTKTFCTIILLALLLSPLRTLAETKSGEIVLEESRTGNDIKSQLSLGNKIKIDCKFYITDYFDKKVIYAGGDVHNTTNHPLCYAFSVAFFDEKGVLLGCTAQSDTFGIKAGATARLGSTLLFLPPELLQKATHFQVAFYEVDPPKQD